jgi:hypothetical protein
MMHGTVNIKLSHHTVRRARTPINVSELCAILYLSGGKKFLINVDGVYICDQQWIPLQ